MNPQDRQPIKKMRNRTQAFLRKEKHKWLVNIGKVAQLHYSSGKSKLRPQLYTLLTGKHKEVYTIPNVGENVVQLEVFF